MLEVFSSFFLELWLLAADLFPATTIFNTDNVRGP